MSGGMGWRGTTFVVPDQPLVDRAAQGQQSGAGGPSWMRGTWWGALLLALVVAVGVPSPAAAQGPLPIETPTPIEWYEERTDAFAILSPVGEEDEAQRYATFADEIYNDLTRIFEHTLTPPITLRLYPSLAAYEQINPLARQITGVVAHAQLSEQEIAVLVPRTRNLTEEEIIDNIRHELTHLIVGDLSGGELPAGLHEGIAQYMERPGRQLETKVELLGSALNANQLMTWSQLNGGTMVYERPDIGYPQSASVVAFLIDRYGFKKFRDFMEALRTAAGYRSAMQTTYGVSADQLEETWRAWLPEYLAGRWRVNAVWAFDTSGLERLVAEGAYTSAEAQIEEAIALLSASDQVEALAVLLRLRDQVQQGKQGSEHILAAREALTQGDYAGAAQELAAARTSFAAIGDQRHEQELQALSDWTISGSNGLQLLKEAQAAAARFEHPTARELARQAGAILTELSHPTGPQQAREVLQLVDQRERVGALGLVLSGVLGLVGNILWRWQEQYRLRLAGGSF